MQPFLRPEILNYAVLLAASFRHWTGREIIEGASALPREALGAALYDLPLPIVSHGTEPDPIFRYANRAALSLWEMEWAAFTRLPSRQSAEPASIVQQDRNRLLAAAMQKGFIEDYSGIRISATGRRFEISQTVLWNVVDEAGERHGQAALIGKIRHLP